MKTESKIRKNLYIEILKYADSKDEFTFKELDTDLNLNQEERSLFSGKLLHDKSLIEYLPGKEKILSDGRHSVYIISVEGKFKLLEYEELIETRQSSKEAKTMAIIAILISGLLAIGSILVQIYNPISLENKQFQQLINNKK